MNNSNGHDTYFNTLDGIRGVAAILILIRHTVPFFGINFPESYLAVDLFFVLSGVVIANAYENRLQSGLGIARFAWLRVARIYPLYILGSILGLISVLGGEPFEGNPFFAMGLAALLLPYFGYSLLFPLNNVSWSLFFELLANFFYAAFLRFLTNRVILAIMLLSALGLAAKLYIYPGQSLDIGWNRPSFVGGFFRVGYSFFTGVFLYRRFVTVPARPSRGMLGTAASLLLIAAAAALLMASPSSAVRPLYSLITIIVLFPAIVYSALWFQPTTSFAKLFKFLGLVSYGMYTLHGPISVLVRGGLHKYAGLSPTAVNPFAPWFGLGFLLVMVGVCWLADKLYDAPMRRLMLSPLKQGPALNVPAVVAERS